MPEQSLASKIRNTPLKLPLKFLIESHIPLRGVTFSALIVFKPFISFLFGSNVSCELERVFSDREQLDSFCRELEE